MNITVTSRLVSPFPAYSFTKLVQTFPTSKIFDGIHVAT